MNIGISADGIIKKLGIEQGFYQIAKSGFECVDLAFFDFLPIKWPYNLTQNRQQSMFETMSDEELLESVRPYKEAAQRYGLTIQQAHAVDPSFINHAETDERLLRIIKRTIMVCGYLECKYLIIHPARCEFEMNVLTHEEEWLANMHLFGELIPYLKKYNVIACLENLFTMCRWEYGKKLYLNERAYPTTWSNPYEINRCIDELNKLAGEKRFGFCLDTGHAFMLGMELDNVIRTIGHRIEALHLHDNDGLSDLHMMPYTGKLPWEKVYSALKEIGYRNTLNFEMLDITFESFENDILPAALDYVAAVGRMFSSRIGDLGLPEVDRRIPERR